MTVTFLTTEGTTSSTTELTTHPVTESTVLISLDPQPITTTLSKTTTQVQETTSEVTEVNTAAGEVVTVTLLSVESTTAPTAEVTTPVFTESTYFIGQETKAIPITTQQTFRSPISTIGKLECYIVCFRIALTPFI